MDSPNGSSKHFSIPTGIVVVLLVGLAAVGVSFISDDDLPHQPKPAPQTTPHPLIGEYPEPTVDAWKIEASETLSVAGWEQPAMTRVLELNTEWFSLLFTESPDAFHEQVRSLKRLGNQPVVMEFLNSFPETAGLLSVADEPKELVEILLDTDDNKRTLLLGLFVRYVERSDIADLIAALRKDRDLICRLLDRGLIGAEVLFLFPREGLGAEEYERWLRENLGSRLAGKDEELASFFHFALLQGQELLDYLNQEESFRTRFRTELWHKLLRVIERNGESLEFYLDAPRYLWELLAHDRGEELLEKRGLLAAVLLFAPEPFPSDFQERAIEILLAGDGITFEAMIDERFRKEPKFRKLLNRPLSASVLAAALNKLIEAGVNYQRKLDLFDQLSDTALTEEVGPPPEGLVTWLPFHAHYMIARKLSQGRDPTTDEWIEAGIDTGSILLPPIRGGKVISQTTKKARNELQQQTLRTGIQTAGKKIGSKAAEQLAKKGTERQARQWAVTSTLTELQSSYRAAMKSIERSASFDITDAVQFVYKESQVGRKGFRRLTGLEARVFMRRDAKVYIHFDQAVVVTKRFLNRALEKTGDDLLTDEEEKADWLKHLAAWWLWTAGNPVLPHSKMSPK